MPGGELKKDYRIIARHQIKALAWGYDPGTKGKHPRLFPVDKDQPPLMIPGSPGSQRSLTNFIADVRRRGGEWPAAS
jgi:hypothetical protein